MTEEMIYHTVISNFYDNILDDIIGIKTTALPSGSYYDTNYTSLKGYKHRSIKRYRQMLYQCLTDLYNSTHNSTNLRCSIDTIENFFKKADISLSSLNFLARPFSDLDKFIHSLKEQGFNIIPDYNDVILNSLKATSKNNYDDVRKLFIDKKINMLRECADLDNSEFRIDTKVIQKLSLSSEIIQELKEKITKTVPMEKILSLFHYFRIFQYYDDGLYEWFCIETGFANNTHTHCDGSSSFIACYCMITIDDEIAEKIQILKSPENIEEIYNTTFKDAIDASMSYSSIKKLLPEEKIINEAIDSIFTDEAKSKTTALKKLEITDTILNSKHFKPIRDNINSYCIVKFNKNQNIMNYLDRDINVSCPCEMSTINRFLDKSFDKLGFQKVTMRRDITSNSSSYNYSCPRNLVHAFLTKWSELYSDKVVDMKGTYLSAFSDIKYIISVVELTVTIFIIMAFDRRIYIKCDDICNPPKIDFCKHINQCLKDRKLQILLRLFNTLVASNILEIQENQLFYIDIAKEIIAKYDND